MFAGVAVIRRKRHAFVVLLFLWSLVERGWHDLGLHFLTANFHQRYCPDLGARRRHIRRGNVFLQEGRGGAAGDGPDLLARLAEDFVSIAANAALDHLEADENAGESLG